MRSSMTRLPPELKFVQIATTVAPQFPTLLYAFDTREGYENFLRETGASTLGKPFDVNGLR